MRRDPIQAVLAVREVQERRRLAEEAAAAQALSIATAVREAAEDRRDTSQRTGGDTSVERLRQLHLGGLAHADAAEVAAQDERVARRTAELATEGRVAAAVSRRSAERLHQRRADETAAAAARAMERQLDAVALEVWRRRS